jgi:hypothetical protein
MGRDNLNANEMKMNCNEANKISIISFLDSLGIKPSRIKANEVWYLSPIRSEKTPSFKVSHNLWFDHGLGKGGKLIDLGILLLNVSVKDFLEILSKKFDSFSIHQPVYYESQSITVRKVKSLENRALIQYLTDRAINIQLARIFCTEIYYSINSKNYFGIGFRNNLNGYEIRNRFFKGSIGPKGISSFKNDAYHFALFEGFIDFLTAYQENFIDSRSSIIVLNSVNQIQKAVDDLMTFSPDKITAYFDNDSPGKNCLKVLQSTFPNTVDGSYMYENFKDLNEMISKK